MKVVTFKADPDLVYLLDIYAINHKVPRSVAIRRAIELMLEAEER